MKKKGIKKELKIGLIILGITILIVALFFIFYQQEDSLKKSDGTLNAKGLDSFCGELTIALNECPNISQDPEIFEVCKNAKTLDLILDSDLSEDVLPEVLEHCQK